MEWGLWKFNANLLKDEKLLGKLKSEIKRLTNLQRGNEFDEWENFKQNIKMQAIERGYELRYLMRREERWLRSHLDTLVAEETGRPGSFINEIRETKIKLEAIELQKYKGAMVRARSEKLVVGETPTKRALSDEKKYARGNEIAEVEYSGNLARDQHAIKEAFVDYYSRLFALSTPKNPSFRKDFLPEVPQLDSELTASLEREIDVKEVEKAIDDLNPGKSPGPDGLTAAFYKAFKPQFALILQRVFVEAFRIGCLPPSFARAHTVLIPKSTDEALLRSVKGYRPITLTNVDYKIFMKVLASRLQSVITDIVGPHQTCGIKGRSIFTNIHVVRSILEYCDANLGKVAMIQVDFSKAFDMVCHDILFAILEHTGLGSVLCDGVRMAYQNCTTNLVVNGELSQRIDVRASVRQGCPMSPLLFALFLEPLCRKIINSNVLQGFRLLSCDVRVLAYADDVAIICADKESVSVALEITQSFCDQTGSLLNRDKSLGLWHGTWLHPPAVFEHLR